MLHTHHIDTILIVDDDESVTTSLSLLFKRAGYSTLCAYNSTHALSFLQEQDIDLIVHDMNFSQQTGGEEGLQLLRNIKKINTEIPVILITAWGSIDLAVDGMKLGASDFLTKPWNNDRVLQVVATALKLKRQHANDSTSREELDRKYNFDNIIGISPKLLQLLETIGRVSATDAPVLILGESGTGKELIADAIHKNSNRAEKSLVKVNLGGIPDNLFESEMFGHVKGAFTDAKSERAGRFALAHGGSIFLDEIGDLGKTSQVKLLRVLQDQSYQPLGSSHSQRADVRIICATNADLKELVKHKQFREDLLYRINLITVYLPPLRERRQDIPSLARYFVDDNCRRYGFEPITLSADVINWLQQQYWPGNIRQLKQCIERAILISENSILHVESLRDSERLGLSAPQSAVDVPVGAMTLDEMEQAMIEKALRQYQNNISQVANALGLSRQALYRRIEKHGIPL